MEVKIMTFDGHPVTFQIERNEKMMVNATEMAKVFGKRVNDFMSMETTLEFVKEALKNGDSRNLKVFSQSDLYVSVQITRCDGYIPAGRTVFDDVFGTNNY